MAKKQSKERPVIVTTARRGVFFGYSDYTEGDTIKLRNARNCLYWSREVGGFMGLASVGPIGDSRIGRAADGTFREVVCVLECTPEAAKVWESAPVVGR